MFAFLFGVLVGVVVGAYLYKAYGTSLAGEVTSAVDKAVGEVKKDL